MPRDARQRRLPLYTLIGNTPGLEAGDDVVLEARYVETSICMQGTTLEVVRVLPPAG